MVASVRDAQEANVARRESPEDDDDDGEVEQQPSPLPLRSPLLPACSDEGIEFDIQAKPLPREVLIIPLRRTRPRKLALIACTRVGVREASTSSKASADDDVDAVNVGVGASLFRHAVLMSENALFPLSLSTLTCVLCNLCKGLGA